VREKHSRNPPRFRTCALKDQHQHSSLVHEDCLGEPGDSFRASLAIPRRRRSLPRNETAGASLATFSIALLFLFLLSLDQRFASLCSCRSTRHAGVCQRIKQTMNSDVGATTAQLLQRQASSSKANLKQYVFATAIAVRTSCDLVCRNAINELSSHSR